MINLSREPVALGDLELELFKLLRLHVPDIIITGSSWTVGSFTRQDMISQIIEQIAWWLFEGDQTKELSTLEKFNSPSNLCGHVFRPGEAIYTCRECAVDPTCVFCQACFRKSEHIKHKYKFHSSGGNGCCDCGDVEAWKQFPYCDVHKVVSSDTVETASQVPQNIINRAQKMFYYLLDYIVNSLTVDKENSSDLPENLRLKSPGGTYITVVYNDETHTFDYVIKVLQRAVSCSASQASDHATIIDREGRSVIRIGSSRDCNASKDVIRNYRGQSILGMHRRRSSLITTVLHSAIVAHQEFSLALLDWLSKIVKQSEGLRNLMSSVLLSNTNQIVAPKTYASSLMLSDKKLWKMARAGYQQLFMATMLLQAEAKKAFGAEYARSYEQVMTGFLHDDHDHSDSISSMSVQLFTVPTLARHLVAEEHILSFICNVIINCCCVRSVNSAVAETEDRIVYALDARMLAKHSNRIEYVFYDLKYVLSNAPTEWHDPFKLRFKEFFQMFIKFLKALEGMDNVLRKTDRHLEREPDWESGVMLQMRIATINRLILSWCSSVEDVLLDCVAMTLKLLESVWTNENSKTTDIIFTDVIYKCVNYDITQKPVSVHYPLTRFFAGLLAECGRLNIPLTSLPISSQILDASERSFRSLALCAQVNAGAWRRNGLGLAKQVYYTRHHQCRSESFDRDLQMLQACAALVDPNQFCLILRQKFNLVNTPGFEEYETRLYEDYLAIIIYVVYERYYDGIGHVTFEEQARREIIHALASGPKPHSKVQKAISHQLAQNPEWEGILRTVAELKASTNIRSGAKYELKPSYLGDVSPCFYHYVTASEESSALTETLRRKKATNQSLASIPRLAPKFTDSFSSVINILLCPFLFSFIKDLLQKYTPKSNWSDKLFEKIFYLIGIGIIEERERIKSDQSSSFNFCEKVEQGGVMDILRKYAESTELIPPLQENVCWIVNAVGDVTSRRMGVVDGGVTEQTFSATSADSLSEVNERKEMARKMRANLIEKMKQMQKKFLENTPEMEEEEQAAISVGPSVNESMNHSSVCTELSWQLTSVNTKQESDVCILCQDESRVNVAMVAAAFVQLSSVLSKQRISTDEALKKIGDVTIPAGLHISSCSHVMHFDCWNQYFQTVKERDEGRYRMRRFLSNVSTHKNEFLCPLCSRLSNCVVPMISHNTVVEHRNIDSSQTQTSLQEWMNGINNLVDPPPPTKREVVVKLDLTAVQRPDNDAPQVVSPEIVTGSSEPSPRVKETPTVEVMEVDTDHYQPTFDMLSECIANNCEIGDTTNEAALWLSTAYTFQVTETVARFQGRPLLSPPSVRIKQALSSAVRSSFLSSKYYQTNSSAYEQQMRLLFGKSEQSILMSNIFCTFVKSIFSCDCLRTNITSSSVSNDKNILFLCALAQIVQIILFIDENLLKSESEPSTSMDVSSSETSSLLDLFYQVRSHAGFPPITAVNPYRLESLIFSSFSPFIRSCALFLRYVTNVNPPESLERNDSFDEICNYLGVPNNITSYFDVCGQTSLDPLVQRWCLQADVLATVQKGDYPKFPDLIQINQLLGMDEDYSDVLAKSSDFLCPRFHVEDDSVTPATCLVCGAMLCSQSYCCQQKVGDDMMGACSYHIRQCGFGTGIFLKGRDCTLVLLNQTRGCYRPAPYLDEFGEMDIGLRRGNPLKLNKGHLKELNLLWLTHAIPETIVRESESSHGIINFDWVHW